MIDKNFELRMEKKPIRLIALSGSAGCGKSVVAEMIVGLLDSWEIKSFATDLKNVASIMLNVDRRKFEDRSFKESELGSEWDSMSVRTFLQKLGTDAIRTGLHPNTWINLLFKDFDSRDPYTFLAADNMIYADDIRRWVIPDARFANEINEVKKRGGITVRIDRPELNSTDKHVSENEWKDLEFNHTITNDGTLEELKVKVRRLLIDIGLII